MEWLLALVVLFVAFIVGVVLIFRFLSRPKNRPSDFD
jgi:hypothetical protein